MCATVQGSVLFAFGLPPAPYIKYFAPLSANYAVSQDPLTRRNLTNFVNYEYPCSVSAIYFFLFLRRFKTALSFCILRANLRIYYDFISD